MKKAYLFLAYLVIAVVLFHPLVFEGVNYDSADSRTATNSTLQLRNETFPVWLPYLFCGMPSFGSLTYNPYSYFPNIVFQHLHFPHWYFVLYFAFAGLGTFLFLERRVGFYPAAFGGMAFLLSPFLVVMVKHGHLSQMMTSAFLPWMLYATDKLFDKRLKAAGLLGLVAGLMIQRGHIQIAYYGFMLSGVWFVYRLLKEDSRFFLIRNYAIGVGLALLLSAVVQLPVREYAPFSIRDAAKVAYATDWSLPPVEAFTYVWPFLFGWGQKYTGSMPFTDFPNYAGLAVFLLACFAIKRVENWKLWVGSLAAIFLIAFGKYTPVYGLLFEYLPYFSKFRVPSMILILAQLVLSILSAYGLSKLKWGWKAGLAGFTLVELVWINSLVTAPLVPYQKNHELPKDAVIDYIKQDSTKFRVLSLAGGFGRTDLAAYGLESVGGYHAAKPKYYQELISLFDPANRLIHTYYDVKENRAIRKEPDHNEERFCKNFLQITNTKYILSPVPIFNNGITTLASDNQGTFVLENQNNLGRFYFVNEMLNKPMHELLYLEPDSQVIGDEDLYFERDSTREAILLSESNGSYTILSKCQKPQILVHSANWFPEWKAFIDGKETKVYRANHSFQAIVVPEGVHNVVFSFESKAFHTGLLISIIAMVVCIVLVIL